MAADNHTTDARARLRAVIVSISAAEKRIAALEQGQQRAREESWRLATLRHESEAALAKAASVQKQTLVYSYINGGGNGHDADPVAKTTARLAEIDAEQHKINEIESAIADEIRQVQISLQVLHATQFTIMSDIVSGSPSFLALVELHTEAWKNLRSVKSALRAVAHELHGHLPGRWHNEADRAEPLDGPRVGYDIDPGLMTRWLEAIEQLALDADTELPNSNGANGANHTNRSNGSRRKPRNGSRAEPWR